MNREEEFQSRRREPSYRSGFDAMSHTFWVACNTCPAAKAGLTSAASINEWHRTHQCEPEQEGTA